MFVRAIAVLGAVATLSLSRADVLDKALANDDACAADDTSGECSMEFRQLRGEKVETDADAAASGPSLLEIEEGFGVASVCVPTRGCSRNDVCQKLANDGGKPITGTVACKNCVGSRKCQVFGVGTAFTCGCKVGAMLAEEDATVEQADVDTEVDEDDDESFIDEDAADDAGAEDEDDAEQDEEVALAESNADEVRADEDVEDEVAGQEDVKDDEAGGRRRSWFDSPRCCRCKYGNKVGWSRSGKCSFCGHKSVFGSYAYKRRVKPSATKCRSKKDPRFPGSYKCAQKCRHDV